MPRERSNSERSRLGAYAFFCWPFLTIALAGHAALARNWGCMPRRRGTLLMQRRVLISCRCAVAPDPNRKRRNGNEDDPHNSPPGSLLSANSSTSRDVPKRPNFAPAIRLVLSSARATSDTRPPRATARKTGPWCSKPGDGPLGKREWRFICSTMRRGRIPPPSRSVKAATKRPGRRDAARAVLRLALPGRFRP